MQDRIGRLNYSETFQVEPGSGVRDPLEGLPAQNGGRGGLSGAPVFLGSEPFEYLRDLNEWVQFEKPGTYHLAVTTRRVSRLPDGFSPVGRNGVMYPQSAGAVELTSNAVTLEIVEAPSEWAAGELRKAVSLLDEQDDTGDADERRKSAGRILRFLGTPAAAREMVRRLGSGPEMPVYGFMLGILGASEPAAILPYMEERLRASDQAVNSLCGVSI